jgi:hypothetical protein
MASGCLRDGIVAGALYESSNISGHLMAASSSSPCYQVLRHAQSRTLLHNKKEFLLHNKEFLPHSARDLGLILLRSSGRSQTVDPPFLPPARVKWQDSGVLLTVCSCIHAALLPSPHYQYISFVILVYSI